jgi:hypothetical protein
MFVLSVEGPGHINKANWTTHEILGCFPSRDEAVAASGGVGGEEEIVIVTDTDTGEAERIEAAAETPAAPAAPPVPESIDPESISKYISENIEPGTLGLAQ